MQAPGTGAIPWAPAAGVEAPTSPTPAAPQIWLYRDKATGELKGDATITYEDPFAANQAPSWFDGKEFMGKLAEEEMRRVPCPVVVVVVRAAV